jgi:hypothetical protein
MEIRSSVFHPADFFAGVSPISNEVTIFESVLPSRPVPNNNPHVHLSVSKLYRQLQRPTLTQ